MHGIVLAGGYGSRLWPITSVVSKQLLPVYDKPMIYYPLSLVMAAGIRDISVITTPRDIRLFEQLLGDGDQWGIRISYVTQATPKGLPEAFVLISQSTLEHGSLLILGDNLFYGSKMAEKVRELIALPGAAIFGYLVNDVSAYGSFELNAQSEIVSLFEKVARGKGYAIPGIYKFDASVQSRTLTLQPSTRGEVEIVDLLRIYLKDELLRHRILDRGTAWLDTGTVENLNQANELVRVIQSRQDMLVGSPDEVALRQGWTNPGVLSERIKMFRDSAYAMSLKQLLIQYE